MEIKFSFLRTKSILFLITCVVLHHVLVVAIRSGQIHLEFVFFVVCILFT